MNGNKIVSEEKDYTGNKTMDPSWPVLEPWQRVTPIQVSIIFLELFLLVLGTVACILFLMLLKRTRYFHLNLRLIFSNFAVSMITLIISRYMIVNPLWIAYVFNKDIAGAEFCQRGKMLHDTAIVVSGMSLLVLVVERGAATIMVRHYESCRLPTVGVVLAASQWLFSFVFILEQQKTGNELIASPLKLPCGTEFITLSGMITALIFISVANAISALAFFVLIRWNMMRNRRASGSGQHPELSERYQTAENIRATRLLLPVVGSFLIQIAIGSGIMFLGFLCLVQKKAKGDPRFPGLRADLQQPNEAFQLFDVVVAAYSIVFPIVATYSHEGMLKTARTMLCVPSKVVPQVLRDLDGRQLALPMNEETDYYFNSLEAMWNNSAPNHRSSDGSGVTLSNSRINFSRRS